MAPISDAWPDVPASLAILDADSADRITSLVSSLHPHIPSIEAYATSLHPTHSRCTLISSRYTWGQSFLVFELLFPSSSSSESWIIRFGMRPISSYFNTAAQLSRKILNEVAALHLVHTRTTIPVPSVLAFHPTSSSPTNPLGPWAPAFVLMTALKGATIDELGICIGTSAAAGDPLMGDETKRPILMNYLSDIADIHVQLSKITFDRIGSFVLAPDGTVSIGPGADYGLGPFESAREYFTIQADAYEKLAEVDYYEDDNDISPSPSPSPSSPSPSSPSPIQNPTPTQTPTLTNANTSRLKRLFVAFLWRAALMPLLDARDDRGPFPMRHGDLHNENILVDEGGHIVGVLDWDCAGTVPWEAFAVPTFEVSGDFVDLGGGGHYGVGVLEEGGGGGGKEREKGGNSEETKDSARLAVHRAFNTALQRASSPSSPTPSSSPTPTSSPTTTSSPSPSSPPSGRTLAELHNSNAGHVAAYLAYWMFCMACDYEHTGRALHGIIGLPEDMDAAFGKFVREGAKGLEGIEAHSVELAVVA